MEIITNPLFWTAMLVLGVVLLIGVSFMKKALLQNVYVAVTISLRYSLYVDPVLLTV